MTYRPVYIGKGLVLTGVAVAVAVLAGVAWGVWEIVG